MLRWAVLAYLGIAIAACVGAAYLARSTAEFASPLVTGNPIADAVLLAPPMRLGSERYAYCPAEPVPFHIAGVGDRTFTPRCRYKGFPTRH